MEKSWLILASECSKVRRIWTCSLLCFWAYIYPLLGSSPTWTLSFYWNVGFLIFVYVQKRPLPVDVCFSGLRVLKTKTRTRMLFVICSWTDFSLLKYRLCSQILIYPRRMALQRRLSFWPPGTQKFGWHAAWSLSPARRPIYVYSYFLNLVPNLVKCPWFRYDVCLSGRWVLKIRFLVCHVFFCRVCSTHLPLQILQNQFSIFSNIQRLFDLHHSCLCLGVFKKHQKRRHVLRKIDSVSKF